MLTSAEPPCAALYEYLELLDTALDEAVAILFNFLVVWPLRFEFFFRFEQNYKKVGALAKMGTARGSRAVRRSYERRDAIDGVKRFFFTRAK